MPTIEHFAFLQASITSLQLTVLLNGLFAILLTILQLTIPGLILSKVNKRIIPSFDCSYKSLT